MLKRSVLPLLLLVLFPAIGVADELTLESVAASTEKVQTNANFVWTLLAAILVFLMQAGFGMLEAGLTRARNVVNIMMKNIADFSFGALIYWVIGFGLMFGASNGFFGTTQFMPSPENGNEWTLCFWMFQVVFAGTAATIVSGALAERTKFSGYLIASACVMGFIYPIFGSWAWGSLLDGQGWLEGAGFIDFAGSTVVHSIGGWCALAGAMVVGPRIGKYDEHGNSKAIAGHNMPMAALGMFILWFGWYGFNAGSTTTADASIALIAMTTTLSAAAGAISAMFITWIVGSKPDFTLTINGALAGLVGITAGCANVAPLSAIVIGAISGGLVILAVGFFERIQIDDPVGAISVHGVCGAWGTLAVALFDTTGSATFTGQLAGIGSAFVFAFGLSYAVFFGIDKVLGLRVSEEEEREGLDTTEHGLKAYNEA